MTREMKREILSLVENAKVAFVSSVTEDGYPSTKAMLALHSDGLFVHCFSTNLSARRSRQFLKNPKACVYFCDEERFMGLLLEGEMEVLTDRDSKALLWREGFEIYYPDGIDTKDYCVLRFEAKRANYYHGLGNADFDREAFENA